MKIVSFIERCQADVIDRILRHRGLWEGPLRTNAAPWAPPDRSHQGPGEPQFVPEERVHRVRVPGGPNGSVARVAVGARSRVPLARGEVAPFFPPDIPDWLAVRADGPVLKPAEEGLGCGSCVIGPILAPKPAQHPSGSYSVWSCTLTTRNGLDISAGQWNMSPIHGNVGSAVGLKSLSVVK